MAFKHKFGHRNKLRKAILLRIVFLEIPLRPEVIAMIDFRLAEFEV